MFFTRFSKWFYFLLIFHMVAGVNTLAYAAGTATAKRVSYVQKAHSAVVTITLSAPLSNVRAFLLKAPLRLVVDMDRLSNRSVAMPSAPKKNPFVSTLRFAHFSPTSSRLVLELSAEPQTFRTRQVYHKKGGSTQLIIEVSAPANSKPYSPLRREVEVRNDTVYVKENILNPKSSVMRKQETPGAAHKHRVVIDAGHGGKDPGAMVGKSLQEKNITLEYAFALKKVLLDSGKYNVVLTRSDDQFILLSERVRIARAAKGEVMVSLHADIAPQKEAKGLSVYTVSEEASDREAEALAKTENEVDKIGAIGFADAYPEVADILIDLASRDTRIKATSLAFAVSDSLKQANILLLKNPNRYAGFRVLKSPDVPSILIELGFLSNKEDERLLQNAIHREKVVRAIAKGLDAYFKRHSQQ